MNENEKNASLLLPIVEVPHLVLRLNKSIAALAAVVHELNKVVTARLSVGAAGIGARVLTAERWLIVSLCLLLLLLWLLRLLWVL